MLIGVIMVHTKRKISILIGLCFILTLLISSGVFATAVFSNTHVWQDKYLASVYAGHENATIHTFQNLADAQLKIKTISKNEQIIILESNVKPVVKNFESVLTINGYTDVEVVSYDSYIVLQEILFDRVAAKKGATSVAVLDPKFGVESIVIAPLLREKGLVPLF